MTDDSEVAWIAAGLTKAQREAIPFFRETPWAGYPANLTKKALLWLIEIGVVDQHDPVGGVGYLKWNLTPLGLAVRSYLQSKGGDA